MFGNSETQDIKPGMLPVQTVACQPASTAVMFCQTKADPGYTEI